MDPPPRQLKCDKFWAPEAPNGPRNRHNSGAESAGEKFFQPTLGGGGLDREGGGTSSFKKFFILLRPYPALRHLASGMEEGGGSRAAPRSTGQNPKGNTQMTQM